MKQTFKILDDKRERPQILADFDAQRLPPTFASHQEGARFYQPGEKLLVAVNAAMAVGAPLLLTGEPGTGKTQVAYWIAEKLGFARDERFFVLSVQSTTTAEALRYEFDNIAYFHAAYEQNLGAAAAPRAPLDRWDFVRPGVIWRAMKSRQRCVVLIDEIDKAPRDFPNDLLHLLDQYEIEVKELEAQDPRRWIRREEKAMPPVVVITSNSERRLPEPFLRRCIFHPLSFDQALVKRAVEARAGQNGPFPQLDEATRAAAIAHFLKLREKKLRKIPSTAELLVWLTILGALGTQASELGERVPAFKLPALGALIKDQEDLALLEER